jgi:hypothetical protein
MKWGLILFLWNFSVSDPRPAGAVYQGVTFLKLLRRGCHQETSPPLKVLFILYTIIAEKSMVQLLEPITILKSCVLLEMEI